MTKDAVLAFLLAHRKVKAIAPKLYEARDCRVLVWPHQTTNPTLKVQWQDRKIYLYDTHAEIWWSDFRTGHFEYADPAFPTNLIRAI